MHLFFLKAPSGVHPFVCHASVRSAQENDVMLLNEKQASGRAEDCLAPCCVTWQGSIKARLAPASHATTRR